MSDMNLHVGQLCLSECLDQPRCRTHRDATELRHRIRQGSRHNYADVVFCRNPGL